MIVEKIFNKDINSIDESDLNHLLGAQETRSLEFKTIPDIKNDLKPWEQKKEETNNKENIIKSVVSFLNANDSGLLVLGVKTKDEVATKIVGVGKDVLKQLKTEFSLEDFIKEKVKAIPSYSNEFKLETKIAEYNDRIVVLIEVLNTNWERIYYSDLTQYVYIRKGKSTESLSISDTLRLIAERSYPQVYMSFKEGKEPCRNGNKIYPVYRVNFINKGVKSTKQVHCFILMGSDIEIDVNEIVGGGYISSLESLDSTNYGLNDFIHSNSHIKVYQFIFPSSTSKIERIYPFNKYSSGYVAIFENDIDKINKVVALTVEDSGFVKQEFKVSTIEHKRYFEETKSEFNPYLTI